jgi:hypothetical protein
MRKPLHLGALGAVLAACVALFAVAPAGAAAFWHPAPTTAAWQWELQGKFELTPGASVFEIDGFEYPAKDVKAIHASGAKAICYLDVGSWEEYRPDAAKFPKSSLGARYEGYPEERWLDIAHYKRFAPLIEARIAMCARKGFDAVEPDNINGWENKTGFPLTRSQQLTYNRWIARTVHKAGMAVALKNDSRQVKQLVGAFDFAVVEECFQYEECELFSPFVKAGKAVFETEYELPTSKFCAAADALGFAAIRKNVELFPQPWEPCHPPAGATG